MKTLIILLVAIPALAQHPNSLPLSRYSEPTIPGAKKTFRHIRLGNKVNDTSTYAWNVFGKVGETEEGLTLNGYQLAWNRATATYYFTITDSALRFYPNMNDTEDSDATYEIKLPLERDKPWQYKLTDSITAAITADDETITVSAGTFSHCIVTTLKDGDETITKTYAPDLGMIKMTTVGPEFSKLVDMIGVKKP